MRIATIFGIKVKVNLLFFALFLLLFMAGKHIEGLIAFGVVILHEMAHVITAINYGFNVGEVELLPFGGVAKIEQGLEGDPYAEIFIAAAGPLANFSIVGLLYILQGLGLGNQQWVPFFIECNLTLGLFNLLPAYPLDGGRIYRAFLASRVGVKGAADKVLRISRIIALLLALLSAASFLVRVNSVNLAVIAFFLLLENFREKGNTMFLFMRYLNRKQQELSMQQLMVARHLVATEEVELREIVRFFVPKKYHLVVRVDKRDKVTGVFTEKELIAKLLEGKLNITLGDM